LQYISVKTITRRLFDRNIISNKFSENNSELTNCFVNDREGANALDGDGGAEQAVL
jgi:hypothetical protein